MKLCLQFGWGMIDHCRALISAWNGGSVILSPRDLESSQLVKVASMINDLPNGSVLVDPQFYLPHSDHERLCSQDYWPAEYETDLFWGGSGIDTLLGKLAVLNREINSREFILPGLLCANVSDDWLKIHRLIVERAATISKELPLVSTIALSSEVLIDQNQIETLLEESSLWNSQGFYLVCEHPEGKYLVESPSWLLNVLDLIAGLKLRGKKVLLGYCNHQMLIAAVAKADEICSGTWMNVRSFPPDKFRADYDADIRRKTSWYYCPQVLSEYQIQFLDMAFRQGFLSDMRPPAEMDGGYVNNIFSRALPSTVGLNEPTAFLHYLNCLHSQVNQAQKTSFDDTATHHRRILDNAEEQLNFFASNGVRGKNRDFSQIIDVNRSALDVIVSTRGPVLRRKWPNI